MTENFTLVNIRRRQPILYVGHKLLIKVIKLLETCLDRQRSRKDCQYEKRKKITALSLQKSGIKMRMSLDYLNVNQKLMVTLHPRV
jgi:hypothetical protein